MLLLMVSADLGYLIFIVANEKFNSEPDSTLFTLTLQIVSV